MIPPNCVTRAILCSWKIALQRTMDSYHTLTREYMYRKCRASKDRNPTVGNNTYLRIQFRLYPDGQTIPIRILCANTTEERVLFCRFRIFIVSDKNNCCAHYCRMLLFIYVHTCIWGSNRISFVWKWLVHSLRLDLEVAELKLSQWHIYTFIYINLRWILPGRPCLSLPIWFII